MWVEGNSSGGRAEKRTFSQEFESWGVCFKILAVLVGLAEQSDSLAVLEVCSASRGSSKQVE